MILLELILIVSMTQIISFSISETLVRGINYDFGPGVRRQPFIQGQFIIQYDATLYIRDLYFATTVTDIEQTFSFYGPPRYIKVPIENPPKYALIEFLHISDALEVLNDLDQLGYCRRPVCGRKVRVMLSHKATQQNTTDRVECYRCGETSHVGLHCNNVEHIEDF